MSFILDALKKSESDRQRQSGPALFEVKVTPPKPRFPYWALALAGLLVINIVVGAWVYLHRPLAQPEAAAAAQPLPPANTAPRPVTPPPAQAAPVAALTAPPAAPPVAAAASPAAHPEPVLSDTQPKDAALNPDDYEPAVAAAKREPEQSAAHVRGGTESGYASYADAAANPDLHMPALRIDLHVYATKPQDRFVLINMHRVHEGDTLPDGGRLESITPEGAIVSFRGSKFFLEHQ